MKGIATYKIYSKIETSNDEHNENGILNFDENEVKCVDEMDERMSDCRNVEQRRHDEIH